MFDNEKNDIISDFTEAELEILNSIYGTHCFTNSLVDFHESDYDNDDGSTIFSYTDSNRYM